MKILAQRPTHISAVATILLITKTFTVKEGEEEEEEKEEEQQQRNNNNTRSMLESEERILFVAF